MKALGIDFGIKRVGLALMDEAALFAYPVDAITRSTRQQLFDDLLEIVEKESVSHIAIGLPLGMDGQETDTTRQARNFADSLERKVPGAVSIDLMDERLTSMEAKDQLREAGTKSKKMKGKLDSQAAVIILETWLNTRSK